MRYLIRAASRRARWLILRERVLVLRYGHDAAELYLALHYLAWGFVMWMPGEATSRAPAWRPLRQMGMGDVGCGVLFTLLGLGLALGVLRLLSDAAHIFVLWATLALSMGLAVALLLGNWLAVSAYDSVITGLICWLVYLRSDRPV